MVKNLPFLPFQLVLGLIFSFLELPQFLNFFGTASNYASSAANINGDDAIELFQNGIVVDVFGDINTGGSGPWEYMDGHTN